MVYLKSSSPSSVAFNHHRCRRKIANGTIVVNVNQGRLHLRTYRLTRCNNRPKWGVSRIPCQAFSWFFSISSGLCRW
ncbi:hypothetical protein Hanom_Chr09g00763881 [Helianthus anomalus]